MATIGGADPANPGTGGIFQSLGPIFSPGFKIVFRPTFTPKQPTTAPAFSDPRGIFPAGILPASRLSYELSDEVFEQVVPQQFTASILGISTSISVQTVATLSSATTAIIVFEGHDVIDLPTTNLTSSADGLVVPDRVFLPMFAGGSFFDKYKGDIASGAALEYIRKSSDNGIIGIVPSINPPLDCIANKSSIIASNAYLPIIDSASNTIKVNGSPQFISYVAMDKPLFRDVITMTTGALADGRFVGDQFTIQTVGPSGDPIVQVLRYAFVNVAPKGQPEQLQWRLAESFGVKPSKSVPTPNNLHLTGDARTADNQDTLGLHFVYDLNDAGDDIQRSHYPPTPVKTGYSPALAAAKSTPGSFFDANFKSQVIPLTKNSFFFQSRLTQKSIVGLSQGINRITTDRDYTSPSHDIQLGLTARMGIEYTVHKFSFINLFVPDQLILLATSTLGADSIAVYRDPCITAMVVHYVENNAIIERQFYDIDWAESGRSPPDSTLKAFLIGENPERSTGHSALTPIQGALKNSSIAAGTKGAANIQSDSLPTALIVGADSPSATTHSVIGLFSSSTPTGTPQSEFVAPQTSVTSDLIIQIPPVTFKSYSITGTGGATVRSVIGAPTKAYLPDLSSVSPPNFTLDDLTKNQLKSVTAMDFPLTAQSVVSAAMSVFGSAAMAYESSNRIDLSYRTSNKQPLIPIRDVTRRIPEDFANGIVSAAKNSSSFPSTSMPYLIPDTGADKLHLFYQYKSRILIKSIPLSIFSTIDSIDGDTKYTPENEVILMAQMQALVPSVAYDGNIKDRTTGIKADLKFNAIKIDPTTPDPAVAAKSSPQISQYSACLSPLGSMFIFIDTNQKIVLRISGDRGQSWTDVLDPKFFFYPQLDSNKKPVRTADTGTDGESPSCFYNQSSRNIVLAFMVESSLLVMQMPEDLLILPQADITKAMANILPEVVYGDLSDDMKNRGISAQATVLSRKAAAKDTFNERVSAHRVGISRTESGHLRLFFFDQNKVLRSLISSDGRLWESEDQYISLRTTK